MGRHYFDQSSQKLFYYTSDLFIGNMRQILLVCALLATVWSCADLESEAVGRVTKAQGFCDKPCTKFWAMTNCAETCGYCAKQLRNEPPCTGDDCPCVDYEDASVCSLAVSQGWCKKPCTLGGPISGANRAVSFVMES